MKDLDSPSQTSERHLSLYTLTQFFHCITYFCLWVDKHDSILVYGNQENLREINFSCLLYVCVCGGGVVTVWCVCMGGGGGG